MKTCPQCGQIYDDEVNFCLTDGTTLDWSSAPTIASVEMPTVVRSAPAIIPVEQPSFQQPFQPQILPAPPPPARSGSGLLWVVIVFLLFLIVAGGIGFTVYLMRPTVDDDRGKATSNSTPSGGLKDEISEEKEKLKAEQEKLDEEREKLEKDRKALEEKKKQTPTPLPTTMPTVPPPTQYRTAYIVDPPTNVRATPNGRIICVIRQRNAPVSILGSTGVRDSNGTWYYTDACGSRGVIHSSQFRY
ncbi:MAG TPA: hypothetical protein PKO33_16465 [Pyrinomonadaceae bacterium]|nr:hypothetical protein [Pyrinomonadaceae bacterium]